jgi:hypothetical protein
MYACMQGTLGRRVQKGLTEAPMMNSDGKIEVIKIRLGIDSIEGFSGHSDRRQIISYIHRVSPKPEKIIVCHGEKIECNSIANLFRRKHKVDSIAPEILETIRLR